VKREQREKEIENRERERTTLPLQKYIEKITHHCAPLYYIIHDYLKHDHATSAPPRITSLNNPLASERPP